MDEPDERPDAADNGEAPEILTNLPRTRPQRASARRAAARPAPAAAPPTPATPPAPKSPKATRPATRSAPRRAAKPAARRAPKVPTPPAAPQGFEVESRGSSISPPSPIELLDGVIGAAGHLAVGTLDRGVRIVRGAVSRVVRR